MTRARILRFRSCRGDDRAFEDRCIGELAASDRAEWDRLQKLDAQLADFHEKLVETRSLFVEAVLDRLPRAGSPRTGDLDHEGASAAVDGHDEAAGGKAPAPEGDSG
jgi:hypothetical protein